MRRCAFHSTHAGSNTYQRCKVNHTPNLGFVFDLYVGLSFFTWREVVGCVSVFEMSVCGSLMGDLFMFERTCILGKFVSFLNYVGAQSFCTPQVSVYDDLPPT